MSTLDDTEDGLDWAELRVIEILVIWLDLEVSIVLLLLDAKPKIADIIDCEACQVVQRLLLFVKEPDDVADECI